MTIRFHLLDALDEIPPPLKKRVARELEAAGERATRSLPLDRVDIVVAPHPFVIPEIGLNGFAHGPGRITITLNPASPRINDPERPLRILGTLAHELHHVARMRSGAWTRTLGGRLVNEGLAQCFEEEAGAPTPFYAVSLDTRTLEKMGERARPLLAATEFDYNAWMFGRRGDPDWPRNTGYSLGYALVKAWLKAKGLSAVDAAGVSDTEVTADWESGDIALKLTLYEKSP